MRGFSSYGTQLFERHRHGRIRDRVGQSLHGGTRVLQAIGHQPRGDILSREFSHELPSRRPVSGAPSPL